MSNELKKEHARRLYDALEMTLKPGGTISLGRWTATMQVAFEEAGGIVVEMACATGPALKAVLELAGGELIVMAGYAEEGGALHLVHDAWDWEANASEILADMAAAEAAPALPPLDGKAAMAARLVEQIDTAKGPLGALYRIKVLLTDRFPREYDGDLVQELIVELNDAMHGHCARIVMKAELGPLMEAVVAKGRSKACVAEAESEAKWEKATYILLDAQFQVARAVKQLAVIKSFKEGRKPSAPLCIALVEVLDDFRGLLEEGLLDEFVTVFGPAISSGWRAALSAVKVMEEAMADDEIPATKEYVRSLHEAMAAHPDALAGLRFLSRDWQQPSLAHMPTLKAVHWALDAAVLDVLDQRVSELKDLQRRYEILGKEVADVND